ncbi:MAG: 30S ribosomal protein S6 [Anaeroplasmataceae bacterium]
MKKYEIMFIVRSTLEQEAVKKEIADVSAIFTNNDSKVLDVKEWGLKELAYEIQDSRKGYYVLANVQATNEAIKEFDRIVGYNENIVRHIVLAIEE